jgi:hypothetical protein
MRFEIAITSAYHGFELAGRPEKSLICMVVVNLIESTSSLADSRILCGDNAYLDHFPVSRE